MSKESLKQRWKNKEILVRNEQELLKDVYLIEESALTCGKIGFIQSTPFSWDKGMMMIMMMIYKGIVNVCLQLSSVTFSKVASSFRFFTKNNILILKFPH